MTSTRSQPCSDSWDGDIDLASMAVYTWNFATSSSSSVMLVHSCMDKTYHYNNAYLVINSIFDTRKANGSFVGIERHMLYCISIHSTGKLKSLRFDVRIQCFLQRINYFLPRHVLRCGEAVLRILRRDGYSGAYLVQNEQGQCALYTLGARHRTKALLMQLWRAEVISGMICYRLTTFRALNHHVCRWIDGHNMQIVRFPSPSPFSHTLFWGFTMSCFFFS